MELKYQIKWALLVLAVIVGFGCSFSHRPAPITNASDNLTPDQITSFTAKAQAGDGDAAYRLANYYYFLTSDDTTAFKWMSIAATNGSANGQFNLGQLYEDKNNPDSTDIKNAKYWFGRAAAKGDTNALEKLGELEKGK